MPYMKLIKLQFFKVLYIIFICLRRSYVNRLEYKDTPSSTGIFLKFTSIISFLEGFGELLWKQMLNYILVASFPDTFDDKFVAEDD